jgi:DNA polymerase-3 subunit beta
MKLTIERKSLLDTLSRVSRIAPAKSTVPIISNVVLAAKSDSLNIKAGDLDIEITEAVPAQVQSSGQTTVNAKMFHDIVRKMPDGAQIAIEYVEGKPLIVKSGRSRFQLQTLPVDDFPDLSVGDLGTEFSIASDVLSRLIEKTQFAVSTEETRYYLNGIHIHRDQDKLVAVATDGHRLAKCVCDLPDGAADISGVIVPKKTVAEVQRIAAGFDGEVEIALSTSKIRFRFGGVVLSSKLIDGTFPDYKAVIPKGQNSVATIDASDLISAAGRVATVSTDRGRAIKLAFGKNTLSMQQKSDIGESEEEIEIEYDAADITIGFNSKYLLDILGTADCDKINVAMNDPGAPALFNPVGQDDVLFIAMPMRVS